MSEIKFEQLGQKVRTEVLASNSQRNSNLESVILHNKEKINAVSEAQTAALEVVVAKEAETAAFVATTKADFTAHVDAEIAHLQSNADSGSYDSLGEAIADLTETDAAMEASLLSFYTSETALLAQFKTDMGLPGDVHPELGDSQL